VVLGAQEAIAEDEPRFDWRKDCGPMAAYMAARYFEHSVDLSECVAGCTRNERGMVDALEVVRVLERLGLHAVGVRATPRQLMDALRPGRGGMIHVGGNHFAVACNPKEGSLLILDSRDARRGSPKRMDADTLSSIWDGVTIIVSGGEIEPYLPAPRAASEADHERAKSEPLPDRTAEPCSGIQQGTSEIRLEAVGPDGVRTLAVPVSAWTPSSTSGPMPLDDGAVQDVPVKVALQGDGPVRDPTFFVRAGCKAGLERALCTHPFEGRATELRVSLPPGDDYLAEVTWESEGANGLSWWSTLYHPFGPDVDLSLIALTGRCALAGGVGHLADTGPDPAGGGTRVPIYRAFVLYDVGEGTEVFTRHLQQDPAVKEQFGFDNLPSGDASLVTVGVVPGGRQRFVWRRRVHLAPGSVSRADLECPRLGDCAVRGRITGAKPLDGAWQAVLLRPPSADPVRWAGIIDIVLDDAISLIVADRQGNYILQGLIPGQYTLTALQLFGRAPGSPIVQQSSPLTLVAGDEASVDFDLARSPD